MSVDTVSTGKGTRPYALGPGSVSSVSGVLFMLVLVVLLPGYLISSTTQQDQLDVVALAAQYGVVVYSGLRLSGLAFWGRPDWVALIIFGFAYTWLGVAPLVQYFAGQNPLGTNPDSGVVVTQSVIVLAGLAAYDIGFRTKFASKAAFRGGNRTALQVRVDRRRVAALGIFALILTPVFVVYLGGIDVLFTSRQARNEFLFSGGYYSSTSKASGAVLTSVASVVPFIALYAVCFLLLTRRSLRRRPSWVLLLVLLCFSNVLLNNPISSSRFWFLVIVLSLLFLLPWSFSPLGVRTITGGFVASSIFVFPYLDAFRYTSGSPRPTDSGVIGTLLTKTDYDSMAQIGNIVTYVRVQGFSFGDNILGPVLFMVPRSVWSDKPLDTGTVVAEFIGYRNANLSAPLWGELFLAFGLLGVVVGFWIIGMGYRLCVGLGSPSSLGQSIYASYNAYAFVLIPLSVYLVLVLRGSLLQAMSRLFVLLFFTLVCLKMARAGAVSNKVRLSRRHKP